MPFIRFTASKRRTYIAAVILLLNKIMPSCSCYADRGLVYIIITASSNCQPSSYIKYTKLNIYSSYNVRSVSNAKYMFTVYPSYLALSHPNNSKIRYYMALVARL